MCYNKLLNIEEKLTEYILSKYKPLAILLHGSRASGHARSHSDWDFAILQNKEIESHREIVYGANVEIRCLVLPFKENEIQGKWLVLRSDNVKVTYDPLKITGLIINKVTEFYKKPRKFNVNYINEHKAWFRSQLDGMIDYQHDQEAFFRKLSELYVKVIQYWFHFISFKYMPQVYKSLPQIKDTDPEYYRLLTILSNNSSNQDKIRAGEQIYLKIWDT